MEKLKEGARGPVEEKTEGFGASDPLFRFEIFTGEEKMLLGGVEDDAAEGKVSEFPFRSPASCVFLLSASTVFS